MAIGRLAFRDVAHNNRTVYLYFLWKRICYNDVMSKSTVKQRVLIVLAGVVLVAFSVWFSAMVNPFGALAILIGSIWFVVWGFRSGKPAAQTISIVVLSVATVVLALTAAYFWWVSGYTF